MTEKNEALEEKEVVKLEAKIRRIRRDCDLGEPSGDAMKDHAVAYWFYKMLKRARKR